MATDSGQKLPPSYVVGFNLPFCERHGCFHKIHGTRRRWIENSFEVVREHHCKKCREEYLPDPPPIINSRYFPPVAMR